MKNAPDFILVAIDGGAASGKSSTARGLAGRFGFLHVDTGSHYRALTCLLLDAGVDLDNEAGIQKCLEQVPLGTRIEKGEARMTISGAEPTQESLRSESVNAHVSQVAAVAAVRRHLFEYQRSQTVVAMDNGFRGLVMEGRDIGSVIFPNATFRFFLEADMATRARRRADQGITDAVDARDRMDSSRKTAPLLCPEGAHRIDTSHLTLDKVIDTLAKIIEAQYQGKTDAPYQAK